MAAGDERVVWQCEDCPSWCVVTHAKADHPHDHKHVSRQAGCSVVALHEAPGQDGSDRDQWYPTELVVCLQRRDGSGVTGVYLGDGFEQRIEIVMDDARRLVGLVRSALDGSGATP